MESRLGRGLDSLISRTIEAEGGQSTEIALDQIRPNPRQPRRNFDVASLEGLAASIRTHGVLQPVVLRRMEDGYELIAGERRFRASRMAGKSAIPATILNAHGIKTLELALIENVQREDLAPLEEAAAYHQLILQSEVTHQEVAQRMGKSRAAITNALRLLELPEPVKELVKGGQLSAGQARTILGATTQRAMVDLAKAAVRDGMTVRQLEDRLRPRGVPSPGAPAARAPPARGAALEALDELGLDLSAHSARPVDAPRPR